ncbi:MAG: ROK family protein [Candidatus Dormiibacterota bacterium]
MNPAEPIAARGADLTTLTPGTLAQTAISIEVGAASIRSALIDAGASILARKTGITPQINQAELVDAIAVPAQRLAEQGARDGLPPTAIGVAVPGVIDEELGQIRRSANLVWKDTPLRRILEDRLHLPTVLIQDARAAALGEALLGAGRHAPDFLFMVLGDGIGSAVVLAGRPRRGAHAVAGELGHIRVKPNGLPCGCGGHGCVETLSSVRALTRRFTLATGDLASVEQVLEKAAAGDTAASAIWREAMAGLGEAMAAAVAVLDCDLVVLGGTLPALAGDRFLRAIEAELEGRLSLVPVPRLAVAQLGDTASLLGAAAAAFEAAGVTGVSQRWRVLPQPPNRR